MNLKLGGVLLAALACVGGLGAWSSSSGRLSLVHEGRLRTAFVVRSSSPSKEALPLLIVLHGAGSGPKEIEAETGFSALALARGEAVVVYPQGVGPLFRRRAGWNADRCCGYAQERQVDDEGFILRLAEEICRAVPNGCRDVFLVGHSNGGMLAHKLAAEHGDKIAGFASVAGAMNSPLVPGPPVRAILIHGAQDRVVRPEGGAPLEGFLRNREDRSFAAAEAYWRNRSGDAHVRARLLPGHSHSWPHSVDGIPTWRYIWHQLTRP